jgi:hypothetical protein
MAIVDRDEIERLARAILDHQLAVIRATSHGRSKTEARSPR